jgi:PII-like signaling protein
MNEQNLLVDRLLPHIIEILEEQAKIKRLLIDQWDIIKAMAAEIEKLKNGEQQNQKTTV